jgi:hypothetical protein
VGACARRARHRPSFRAAFGITDFHEIRWYAPANVTIDEVLERDRRAQEQADKAAAEEKRRREARRKDPPLRTLTLGDEDRLVGAMSLRELAHRLEATGGVLMIEKDGGLTVRATTVDENMIQFGRALSNASETILACVKHKPGAIDPESLPDAQLTLGGDLLPAKLLGHGQIEQR